MRIKKQTQNQLNKASAGLSPNEIKVHKTLHSLGKEPAIIVLIPLRLLARKAKLGYDTVKQAVSKLNSRGEILFFPGKNQWITSCFIIKKENLVVRKGRNRTQIIPKKAKNISRKAKIPAKKLNVKNVLNDYINIINNVRNTRSPSSENPRLTFPRDALAFEIAQTLNDEKNLALYLAYCRRYSAEIINRAFEVVKETPIERIKRSRGAFFTYLVKRYAQNQNHPNPGD